MVPKKKRNRRIKRFEMILRQKKFRLISILRLLWITVSLIESYPVPNIILVVLYTFTAVILFWVALCGYVIHRLCRIYTFLHTVAPHLDKTNMWSILRAITAQHTRVRIRPSYAYVRTRLWSCTPSTWRGRLAWHSLADRDVVPKGRRRQSGTRTHPYFIYTCL